MSDSSKLTNGGGVAEAERCHKLTKQLGVEVCSDKYDVS